MKHNRRMFFSVFLVVLLLAGCTQKPADPTTVPKETTPAVTEPAETVPTEPADPLESLRKEMEGEA